MRRYGGHAQASASSCSPGGCETLIGTRKARAARQHSLRVATRQGGGGGGPPGPWVSTVAAAICTRSRVRSGLLPAGGFEIASRRRIMGIAGPFFFDSFFFTIFYCLESAPNRAAHQCVRHMLGRWKSSKYSISLLSFLFLAVRVFPEDCTVGIRYSRYFQKFAQLVFPSRRQQGIRYCYFPKIAQLVRYSRYFQKFAQLVGLSVPTTQGIRYCYFPKIAQLVFDLVMRADEWAKLRKHEFLVHLTREIVVASDCLQHPE